jgi:transcriptional regulator with PAS, ATPase and Fis domain
VFRSLKHALESKVPVLIRGESGTGKELVAKAVHRGSARQGGPFVAVNCAGIPDTLLEAELFGYERGAFTGAVGRKLGRFDLAQRGTLLLDEIGEMDPSLQAKLLRVLQESEYQRLGGVETLKADVRIVSATNRNLEEEVARERFREDLYYRLAVFTVELPPLRHRHGDVPLLVDHFITRAAAAENKRVRGVEPMALELLETYSFPGNVRQLENVIAHGVVAARGRMLRMADLPNSFLRAVQLERDSQPVQSSDSPTGTRHAATGQRSTGPFPTLAEVEWRHCQAALERSGGNKAEAARLLGVSRMTLYRKLKR